MGTYKFQVTSGSATATTDRLDVIAGIQNDGAAVAVNGSNLHYGLFSVDASGRVFVTGNLGITGGVGITGGTANAVQSGTWIVIAISSAITASAVCYQNGTIWGVTSSATTASITGMVTEGSATAATDIGIPAMSYINTTPAALPISTNLKWGWNSIDANGRLWIVGSQIQSNNFAASSTKGVNAFALASAAPLAVGGSGMHPLQMDLNGALLVTATGAWIITGTATIAATTVTAAQNGVIWGVTSSATTASQNGVVWGVTASAVTASANVDADTYAAGTTRGYVAMGLVSAASPAWAPSAIRPHRLSGDGSQYVTASAVWPVSAGSVFGVSGNLSAVTANQNGVIWGVTASAVTASQNGVIWGVTSSGTTASANISAWGGTNVNAAQTMSAGISTSNFVSPLIGSLAFGFKSDGTTASWDLATLPKLHDIDTAAGTIEYDLGISMRVGVAGGSRALGAIDNAPSGNASGFVDGTSPVMPVGFLYDETAGTSLTEDDIAAARVNVNRAQVIVMEDATTRGNKAAINSVGSQWVQQYVTSASSTTTTVPASASVVTGGTLNVASFPLPTWTLYLNKSANGTAWVSAQVSPDNSNWMTVTSTALTGGAVLTALTFSNMFAMGARFVLSASSSAAGAGSATASAWIVGGNS